MPARSLPADGRAQLKQALGTLSATRPGVPFPFRASLYCIWWHLVLLVGTATAAWHFIQERDPKQTATLQLQAYKQLLSTPAPSCPDKQQQMKGHPRWYIFITTCILSLEIHESKILRSVLYKQKSCKLTVHLCFSHVPTDACRSLPLLFLILNICWPTWLIYISPQNKVTQNIIRNALRCTAHPTRSEPHQHSVSHSTNISSGIIKNRKLNHLSH